MILLPRGVERASFVWLNKRMFEVTDVQNDVARPLNTKQLKNSSCDMKKQAFDRQFQLMVITSKKKNQYA